MVATHLELAKVPIRQDQPLRAIELYQNGLKSHKSDPSLIIGVARIHELLNDAKKSFSMFR